jgi:hypothetical protein
LKNDLRRDDTGEFLDNLEIWSVNF